MKYIQYSVFFCLVVLGSCEERDASGPGTVATKPVAVPALTPAGTPSTTVPVPAAGNIVTASSTAKLNPAHGQPGHRCDIAVGAPLTGSPAQPAKPALSSTPVINPAAQAPPTLQTSVPVVPTTAAAPAINPAHGKPGHRCDVAVGSPIPKTASTNVKPATTFSPLATPVQNSPLQPLATPATSTVTSGLNPAHGQPGHRCDIEVGKPLNSAPKKN